MIPLRCAVKHYGWGRPGLESVVARLHSAGTGEEVVASRPYAELWCGTHPSGPSSISVEAENGSVIESGGLKEWLQDHPHALGAKVLNRWKTVDLPFLFKVLSVSTALSIQAHPDKKLAQRLHAQFPEIYKDDNHKPEMPIAVTPFEALCGFVTMPELAAVLETVAELVSVLGEDVAHALVQLGRTEAGNRHKAGTVENGGSDNACAAENGDAGLGYPHGAGTGNGDIMYLQRTENGDVEHPEYVSPTTHHVSSSTHCRAAKVRDDGSSSFAEKPWHVQRDKDGAVDKIDSKAKVGDDDKQVAAKSAGDDTMVRQAKDNRCDEDTFEAEAVETGHDAWGGGNGSGKTHRATLLRKAFTKLMTSDKEVIAAVVARHVSALNKKKKEGTVLSPKEDLVLRLDQQHPGDVGVLAAYFLNYVRLAPGEGVYLSANEPHAYLAGDSVECMATSDNVVRAGLTPKFRDTDTLCSMLTYEQGPPHILRGTKIDEKTWRYSPPLDEFEVDRISIEPGTGYTIVASPGPSIVLTFSGRGSVACAASNGDTVLHNDHQAGIQTISEGSVFFVPANTAFRITAMTKTVDDGSAAKTLQLFRSGVNSRALH